MWLSLAKLFIAATNRRSATKQELSKLTWIMMDGPVGSYTHRKFLDWRMLTMGKTQETFSSSR